MSTYPWWYERGIDQEAVQKEKEAILSAPGVDIVNDLEAEQEDEKATILATERVVRRTVSDKMKEWLKGVASWGPEAKRAAVRSGKRMKELGWLE